MLTKGSFYTNLFDVDCRNIAYEIGRTEVIMDNLDPKFVRSFQVEYHFEER